MKVKELLNITEWETLCSQTVGMTDLNTVIDPVNLDKMGHTIGRRVYVKFGNKPVNDVYDEYVDTQGSSALTFLATDLALTYGDSWKRIYDALIAEYNPIENYDRTEQTERHTEDDGSTTMGQRIDIKGQQVDTDGAHTITYGEQTNVKGEQSNTKGEQSNVKGEQTNTIGAQDQTTGSQTLTTGAHTDTHEHQKSAYDQNGYSPDSKDIDDIAQRVDTSGQRIDTAGEREDVDGERTDVDGERTDVEGERTDVYGQHLDTYGSHDTTYGQRSDTKGSQTDTDHKEGEELYDSHIHGNIGVTTNQMMILQEIDLRARMRFIDIIVKDIVNEMTLKCY